LLDLQKIWINISITPERKHLILMILVCDDSSLLPSDFTKLSANYSERYDRVVRGLDRINFHLFFYQLLFGPATLWDEELQLFNVSGAHVRGT
jgi:hypothetical protein